MLIFEDGVVSIYSGDQKTCEICGKRRASLVAPDSKVGSRVDMCGHCLLYDPRSEWGHERRDEISNVGRASQEMALQHEKKVPVLDKSGRLTPGDAERFCLGIMFAGKLFRSVRH